MLQDKPRYSHWKNGAVYDHAIGRIVARDTDNEYSFTSESAKLANVTKREKYAIDIENGLMEGAKVDHPGKAIQSVIAAQVRIATGDTSRSVDAARLILQASEAMPDKQASAPTQDSTLGAALHDVRDMLAMVMQERARRDSVPVSVHDDDTVIDSTCVTLPDDASEQAGGDEDA
jgi:hypothetical protein